jgi:hypothetical protein
MNLHVVSTCMHPLGVGLLEFETSMHRDILMVGNVYAIDGVLIRFIGHDYGRNERSSPYTKYRWIMMLGYPLDYRALNFIDQAVTSFGKLVSWHNNPRAHGFVLVKCLYNGTDYVPRSFIFRKGERSEASWSCPPPPKMTSHQMGQPIPATESGRPPLEHSVSSGPTSKSRAD